jgi:O-antigen/teichoic acid export membrane protein
MIEKSKKQVSIITLLFSYSNQIFNIARGLVLIPFYLNFFSLSMYGAWLATGNIVGMLGLLDGGMNLVYSQKLSKAYGSKNLIRFSKITTSGLFISILMVSSIAVIGLIISPFAANWANALKVDYQDLQTAFIVAVASAGFGLIYQNLAAIIGSWLEASANGLINLISIIIAITSIIVALYSGYGVISIPIGGLTRGLLGTILSCLFIVRKFKKFKIPKLSFELKVTKELIRDTLPLTASRIGDVLVNQSQFLIISNFINPTITAIYALTVRVFTTMGSFIAPISSSLFNSVAYFDLKQDLDKIKIVFRRVLSFHGAFSALLLSSVLSLNHAFVNLWIGNEKYGGDMLSILTLASLFIFYRYNFISTFLLSLGIIKKNAFASIVEMILRLILIFLLIRHLDILSLPIAQLTSALFILVLFYFRILKMELKMKSSETFKVLTEGFYFILFLLPLSLLVMNFNYLIESWSSFIIIAIIIFTIYVLIIVLISKNIRNEFNLLLTSIRRKLYEK